MHLFFFVLFIITSTIDIAKTDDIELFRWAIYYGFMMLFMLGIDIQRRLAALEKRR